MQRKLERILRSDEEQIKEAGLVLDYDEIARKGSMSREESAISKWYGIYGSRQPGNHMARVVIPGGKITSVKARALARIAATYGPDRISFTTRQAAQFHCLKLKELPLFLRDIAAAGMTTFHGCGDVTRNVAACSWASICPHRRLDVLPYAQETAALLSACRDLDNLPRKFKITFSGCGGNCGQPHINCVGVIALQRKNETGALETGFRVLIGGGMGWQPFIGQELYSFVPPEQIAQVCRAVGIVFRDHGDRYIRMYARLKFVVHRLGIDACRDLVNAALDAEGVDRGRITWGPVQEEGAAPPDRAQCMDEPLDADGMAIERIMVPKGETSSQAFLRIAELADIYGDKHVYLSNRQNLELHGVKPEQRAALRAEIAALGFHTEGFHGLRDVVACVGTTYCPMAVTRTHDVFELLQPVIHEHQYGALRDRLLINISGCPNSCAQFSIADIGLRGLRIREKQGSVEGYRITLGGREDRLGETLGEYKVEDCPRVVRTVLDVLLAADTTETLADHVGRVGLAPYLEAVAALNIHYEMAANPLELSTNNGFGETPRDLKAVARDVPCQNACPAKTNIPQYIRHIALGEYDAAFRINQEDNVFPNVLGRVCTRPCEDRCRYQWTSTRGPVRICSLKRASADARETPPQPLAAWYSDTGKKAAVVGAGPAGLAAARELKRYGHAVTVFDGAARPGGQMRAIPAFRLPESAVDRDIDAIVQSGIELRLGETLTTDDIARLTQEYDAVLVAVGANTSVPLSLPGLAPGAAYDGLSFMLRYSQGNPPPVSGNVVIIGGGFTAVDCARAARRLVGDAGTVSILYRRGEAQMAASADELHEMHVEHIHIETLASPVEVRMDSGHLRAAAFERNLLGEPDASGKPRFIPIPDSRFEVPCDTLILAIGQTRALDLLPPTAAPTPGSHHTALAGVFVAGDFASGSGDIIHAAADGKAAADEMDAWLMGAARRKTAVHIQPAGLTGRTRDHDLVYPPAMPVLPSDQRDDNAEVELGYDAERADEHAWRCYLCNHKFEIDQDKCIHCDWCIRVSPRQCIRRLYRLDRDADGAFQDFAEALLPDAPEQATYIWIDSDQCIRCGNCINVCPVGAISVRTCDRTHLCS